MFMLPVNEGHVSMYQNVNNNPKTPQQKSRFSGLHVIDPRSRGFDRPLSCQSLGHSEQMLAQPAGHGDLETISKGVFFGSVGTQLSPPGNGDSAQQGISERYERASVCLCVRERLRGSIVCHSSFSEKVPVNQSHALCNTALNEIQWTD